MEKIDNGKSTYYKLITWKGTATGLIINKRNDNNNLHRINSKKRKAFKKTEINKIKTQKKS